MSSDSAELDALCIAATGRPLDVFARFCSESPGYVPSILPLGWSEAHRRAAHELADELEKRGVPCWRGLLPRDGGAR